MSDGPKILIVDDEPNIRDLLTTSLRFAGFAVRAVGNGAQAISAVLEEEPDLIILDVMLPDMNGFEFAETIRADNNLSTMPIIALSSLVSPAAIERGRQAGFHDYVAKFDRPGLIAALKEQTADVQKAA